MSKIPMRDMIILLPGIMGSVLQKDGQDLWALSGQAFWRWLWDRNSLSEALRLSGDDPEIDDIGDGIKATRVIPDAHLIPGFGLGRIDGYSKLASFICHTCEVRRGSVDERNAPNFIEFPYDWRRGNQLPARQLQRLIARHLPRWRKETGAADAKVILLAHSMGGLVARYYLEVLEGWRNCRALITFGTPYRGSLDALNYLANGHKYERFLPGITDAMRTFTSLYQLLPIYPAVKVGQHYRRVAEVEGIPHVERYRAQAALEFHRTIETAVERHAKQTSYQKKGYQLLPCKGIEQTTLQSAILSDVGLTVHSDLHPVNVDEQLYHGDGTVPHCSAIPLELSAAPPATGVGERHGSLQNNQQLWQTLTQQLRLTQVKELDQVRSAFAKPPEQPPVIKLQVEDVYLTEEPIILQAKLLHPETAKFPLKARLESVETGRPIKEAPLQPSGDGWELTLAPLPVGLYRLRVQTDALPMQAPSPVHELFEVVSLQ